MRILAFLCLAAWPLQARTRTVHFPTQERILAILAHPDDEGLIAPLLARKCVTEHASCTLLAMSRGENAPCKLPEGCPDLGAMRAGELLVAAAALHVVPIQWSFADVFNPEVMWPANAAEEIAKVIASVRPDVIYTFDPNHGSSCHQAHRYTAKLVLSVAHGVRVQMIETEIVRSPAVTFAPATMSASVYDARPYWSYVVTDVTSHRSQFTPSEVDELRNMPDDLRRVWLMDAEDLGKVTYTYICD